MGNGSRFVAQWVTNLNGSIRIDQIECAEVFQAGFRKARTVAFGQFSGQVVEYLPPISRPTTAALDLLHDLTTDQPIRQHHVRVYRPHDVAACLFEDACHAVKQGRVLGRDGLIKRRFLRGTLRCGFIFSGMGGVIAWKYREKKN